MRDRYILFISEILGQRHLKSNNDHFSFHKCSCENDDFWLISLKIK